MQKYKKSLKYFSIIFKQIIYDVIYQCFND